MSHYPISGSPFSSRIFSGVKAFMEKGGQRIGQYPGDIDEEHIKLSVRLIREEFEEYIDAIEKVDLAEIADALGDLIYVTAWASNAWGFPMEAVMDEIQRANMAKFGPGSFKDEHGKVQKPPGWKPPDIQKIINRHLYR